MTIYPSQTLIINNYIYTHVNNTVAIHINSLNQTGEGDPKEVAKISAIDLLTTRQPFSPYSVVTDKLFF